MIKNNKGFTLLFASLIVSLILSISLAIAHISLSQIILSSAGKESQKAFYNADSGLECAMYYEYNVQRADGTPYFATSSISNPSGSTLNCAGNDAVLISTTRPSNDPSATTTTSFSINPPTFSSPTFGSWTCLVDEPSFEVKVSKTPNVTYPGAVNVLIEARGYNTCDDTNLKRVERGLYTRFVD
jgi:Tfp pilus assembly protein PilE